MIAPPVDKGEMAAAKEVAVMAEISSTYCLWGRNDEMDGNCQNQLLR